MFQTFVKSIKVAFVKFQSSLFKIIIDGALQKKRKLIYLRGRFLPKSTRTFPSDSSSVNSHFFSGFVASRFVLFPRLSSQVNFLQFRPYLIRFFQLRPEANSFFMASFNVNSYSFPVSSQVNSYFFQEKSKYWNNGNIVTISLLAIY